MIYASPPDDCTNPVVDSVRLRDLRNVIGVRHRFPCETLSPKLRDHLGMMRYISTLRTVNAFLYGSPIRSRVGIVGTKITGVIVDELARGVVQQAVRKFVAEEMPRVLVAAAAQQGKGPRKRTGGKYKSKWDRWG